jgi:uncharacterized protein YegP (UPF0339 family)
MSYPKFTIFKDSAGEFRFNLFAVNGKNILRSSEGYTTKQSCKDAISSVKVNSPYDSRYSRLTASNGQYYFILNASNGEELGISEMYTTIANRENGISAVKRDAPNAPTEDLT